MNVFKTTPFFVACLIACFVSTSASAQSLLDDAPQDARAARMEFMKAPLSFFKSQRLINFNTSETVPKGELSTRVAHRFGNAATKGTNIHTLFGLDVATDIWIGADYGITDHLQVGLARVKGAGNLGEQWTTSGKLRLPINKLGNLPVRMAFAGNVTASTQEKDPFVTGESLNNSPFARRVSYMGQFIIAVAPKGPLVLQLAPTWVWRNYVGLQDANGLLALPISARVKITKRLSVTAEYAPLLAASSANYRGESVFGKGKNGSWYAPLCVAAEVETGGHVFQLSLTNSSGLLENDLIPYSTQRWGNGGFRLGFAIMRGFQLVK